MPDPFICWESRCNNGDLCDFNRDKKAVQLARDWCDALEGKFAEIAKLGNSLLENPPAELGAYLYPHRAGDAGQALPEEEWSRRAVAAWYAILRHGIEHGDILEYW